MPKGKKICECGLAVGPRLKICKSCGYEFKKKEKKPSILSVEGRGRKKCPHCGTVTGPRKKVCDVCHKPFQFVPSTMKEKRTEINWRELERGDHVRVITGSGPYWPIENELGLEDRINMGYYGIYTVAYLADNGIHAYPVSKHEAGHCFIYMGKTETAKTGLVRAPHRIVKVKRKVRPNA